jgi:hypothetical protein
MQGVEQITGAAVDQRAEFTVGQERPVELECTRPSLDAKFGGVARFS